jgi:hypothetical protein
VLILEGTPEAKAVSWGWSDAEARKPGERTGLDTPVVLAVNDECWTGGGSPSPVGAKAGSTPPGEYGRKAETQRN